jgi:hypothetical protein
MNVTIWSARIYGSQNTYSDMDEGWSTSVAGYPGADETVTLYMGRVPEHVLHASKAATAFLFEQLSPAGWREAQVPPAERDRLIYERLRDASSPAKYVEGFGLWVTVTIERAIDLPDTEVHSSAFGWLGARKMIEMDEQFRPHAEQMLDLVVAMLGTVLRPGDLGARLSTGNVYFGAVGKEPISVGTWTVNPATVSIGGRFTDLPFEELGRVISELPTIHRSLEPVVGRSARWVAAAMEEADPFKKFQFCFFGIELMASGLLDHLKPELLETLASPRALPNVPDIPVAELLWPTGGVSDRDAPNRGLAFRFAVMAVVLSPDTSGRDSELFRRLLRVRNQLAHGGSAESNDLPVNDGVALLERYFRLLRSYATR